MVLHGCGQDTSPVAASRGGAQSAAAGEAGARGGGGSGGWRLHVGAQRKVLGLELFGGEVEELGDAMHARVEGVAGISQLQVVDEDGEALGILGGGGVAFLILAFEFLTADRQEAGVGRGRE